jgi:hypothetical protein
MYWGHMAPGARLKEEASTAGGAEVRWPESVPGGGAPGRPSACLPSPVCRTFGGSFVLRATAAAAYIAVTQNRSGGSIYVEIGE